MFVPIGFITLAPVYENTMADSTSFAEAVKQRDEYHCVKCGYKPSSKSLHAHHILPDSLGGEDIPDNGAALCATCHRFAPDYDTVIRKDAYQEAFKIYRQTYNPPEMDMFWFGMQASESGTTESEQFQKNTMLTEMPNLSPPNWWIYFAGVADYDEVRSLVPLEWSKEGRGIQTELSGANIQL